MRGLEIRLKTSMYLALVRPHLGHATQVCMGPADQLDLIGEVKRVQRRATKYILKLPLSCEQSYKNRLIELKLLPLTNWHEILDIVFFFKIVNGLVDINPDITPEVRNARTPYYRVSQKPRQNH